MFIDCNTPDCLKAFLGAEPLVYPMPREVWLLLGVLMTLLAVLIMLTVWAVYPVFGTTLITLFYLAWWYVSTEQTGYVHHAQEFENRFVTLLAFVFSSCVVFINDSPLAIGRWSIGAGLLVVALVTFSVHTYDRYMHRLWIARVPHMSSGYASSTLLCSIVEDKLQRINRSLSKLDNALVATNIQYLIMSGKMLKLEHMVVNILQDCTADELNYLLPRMRLGLVLYKVRDHSDAHHRTQLLDLIAVTRVLELSVTSRAVVLDALQQMRLTAHPKSGAYARNILTKTLGDDLTKLKCLCDNKGDFQSLHKLVYNDIKDERHRKAILKHISRQANVLAAHVTLGTRAGRDRSIKPSRKILCDIDDTLTSSGGRYPAGVDCTLPRKTVYPGVLEFLKYLDLGKWGPQDWPLGWNGNLVFLSARPHLYKNISEARTFTIFKKLKDKHGMHTTPSLLPGSVHTGASFVIMNDMEPLARKKYKNFEEYASLYPEFRMVFIGDNGQGDVRTAELMLESELSGQLDAIFIHLVQPLEDTYGYAGPETSLKWQNMGIHFFSDYIEAATGAYDEGLIHTEGMQHIGCKAVADFETLRLSSPLVRETQRQSMNNSIERANVKLNQSDLPSIPFVPSICMYEVGAVVITPFGHGRVQAFRPHDGVYEVALEWPVSNRGSSLCLNSPQSPLMVQQQQSLTAYGFSCKKDVYSGANNIPSQHERVVTGSHLITSNGILGQRPPPNCTEGSQEFWNYHHESSVSKQEISLPQIMDNDHSSSSWSFGFDEMTPPVIPKVETNNNTSPPHQDDVNVLRDTITTTHDRNSMSVADLIHELPGNIHMEHSSSDLELYRLNDRLDKDENGKVYPMRQISSCVGRLSLPDFVISEEEDAMSPQNTSLLTDGSTDYSGKSQFAYNFDNEPSSEPDGPDGDQAVKTQIDGKQEQPREQWQFHPVGYFQLESLQRASTDTAQRTTRGQRFRSASLAVTPFYSGRRKPRQLRVGDSVILTPFGAATVVSLPYNDSATCELLIHDWVLRNGKAAKAYVPLNALQNGEMKNFLSPIMYPGKLLGESLLGLFSSSSKSPHRRRKGLHVVTSFGSGVVLQCRDALSGDPLSNSSSTIVSVQLIDCALRKKGRYAVAHLRASEVWLEGGTPEVKPFIRIYKGQSPSAFPWSFNSLMSSFKQWPHQALSTADSVGLSSYPMFIPIGTLIKTPFFGLGIIKAYRQIDGIYTMSLLDVRQHDNRCCWLSYVDNVGLGDILCAPDDCIITPYGLGKVLQTREEDAVVEVLVGIMHCFLQPQLVNHTAPTPLGHEIDTSLGRGMVLSFSNRSCAYCIDLGWGIMYVPETTAWDEFSSVKTKEGLGILSSMWAFVRGIRGRRSSKPLYVE